MPKALGLSMTENSRVDDLSEKERRVFEIRAIALYALLIDDTDFKAFRYFAELKSLSSPRMRGEWLEARIATCIAGRIRPAIVVRTIKQLRNFRDSRGEIERFVAFEDLLKSGLGEERLTSHGFRPQSFADMDHSPIWDRIGEHMGFLTRQGYEVFLNSGTLLGVVRDGRLIDHDDDIDLAIILHAESAETAAQEWSALRSTMREAGILVEEQMMSDAIFKLTGHGDVKFDLFPAWFEGDRFFVYPHTFGDLTRDDVLPLSKCPKTGHYIPADSEKMLANNYGTDWRTPDPYFKFPWNAAKRKFKTFLAGLK